MWIKRARSEIRVWQRQRRRRNLRSTGLRPGLLALACAITAGAVQSITRTAQAGSSAADAMLFNEAVQSPFLPLLVFGAVYILCLAVGALRPAGLAATCATVICDRCRWVLPRTRTRRCACGGKLEPIALWRWDEGDAADNPADKNRTSDARSLSRHQQEILTAR